MNKRLLVVICILLSAGFCWGGVLVYEALGEAVANSTTVPVTISSPELDQLNQDIANKKSSIEILRIKQQEYQQAILQKQSEKADLLNQIAIFDNRIAASQANIDDVQLNIDKTELEIKKVSLEISLKLKEIDKQKEQIGSILGVLYKEGEKSDLEVILMNDNLSQYIDELQHIRDINSGLADKLDGIKTAKDSLEQDQKDLNLKKLSLEELQKTLQARMNELNNEKGAKAIILDETKQSESQYQKLLSQAKKEQESAAWDIANMEKVMRQRLAKNGEDKNLIATGFIWPVPKNTITAYFHDPDYPYRKVMEHPAVDIRAAQGTPIHAAASGYVARAKDGGMGYSYIMIVHAGGLSTVYGHVSKIMVSEEQYISQGQVIGLSGATPGTPGAGPMTTGAHLHFETRLNGIPVNPLDYIQ